MALYGSSYTAASAAYACCSLHQLRSCLLQRAASFTSTYILQQVRFFLSNAAGRTSATSSCEFHRLSGKYKLVVSTMVVFGDHDWCTSLAATIAP